LAERVRILVVGWSSVLHGEATAGDVLSMDAVATALVGAGADHDMAWSAVMCPPGGLQLMDADPLRYTHLVFVCGPLSGDIPAQLHQRFAHCRRIAVDVTVIDQHSPAVTGFHVVIPRDVAGVPPRRDLAARRIQSSVPVIGVYLTDGQGEYGERRRHAAVSTTIQDYLTDSDAAAVLLDTRLDPRDWRLATRPAQVESLLGRLDGVITMRLHGLVLALKNGVPAVAVDPIVGGGKVLAQAAAWGWPAVMTADRFDAETLHHHLQWCLSEDGRRAAAATRAEAPSAGDDQLSELITALGARAEV